MSLLENKDIHKSIPFAITFAAVALVYFFPQDDTRTILIFVALLLVFLIYRFDMRIFVFLAIGLLVIGAILTAFGSYETTSRVALITFWLLVTGISGIVIDSFRKVLRNRQEK